MAKYTVRIVLHDADSDDYDELYEAMDEEGFSDEIASNAGKTYKMPDGEYDISGSLEIDDVLKKAKNAASKTRKKFAVLVTQSSKRTWDGLEKI